MQPTYEELLAENKWLRENAIKSQKQILDELIQVLLADDAPLVTVKAEVYESRIYELELDYMMQLEGSPESQTTKDTMERVIANYHRAYPDRPLNPKPRPCDTPPLHSEPAAKPPRKPYTKRNPAT